MLSHRVPRLFPRLALLTILLGLLPPASTPDALASVTRPVASELAAAPVATPPSSGPIARPSGAHSSGLPTNSAAGISAQYESHHTLNGVFDGRFATPRAIAAAEPGPFSLSDPANPTTTFVIPAGIYDSVDLDVWARSYHWYWGVQASIAVRPLGTTTWSGIEVFSVGGTDGQPNGASASPRITLGWAAPAQSALEVQLSCSAYKGGDCTFSNIRFSQDVAGWQLKDVSNSF